jgi:hypothetical protein
MRQSSTLTRRVFSFSLNRALGIFGVFFLFRAFSLHLLYYLDLVGVWVVRWVLFLMQNFKEFIPGTGLVASAQQQSLPSPTVPQDRTLNVDHGSPSRSFQPQPKQDTSQRLKAQAKEFIPHLSPQDNAQYSQYVDSNQWYLNQSSQSRETAENLVEVISFFSDFTDVIRCRSPGVDILFISLKVWQKLSVLTVGSWDSTHLAWPGLLE